jgi:anaerobic magnesium-protoporphyrin IX monomethyl ester cyclase
MKVLLINPYSQHQSIIKAWKDFEHVAMPLGLCYIASHLRVEGVDVEILDSYAERKSFEGIAERIGQAKPGLIGITCPTPSFEIVRDIAQACKEKLKNILIVAGGYHPTLAPEEVLKCPHIDYVIRGEGEYAMCDLVKAIRGDMRVEEINGLSYKKQGGIVHNTAREPIKNLDCLEFPAIDLLNLKLYRDPPHWEIMTPSFNVVGSRGCNFNCSFCIFNGVFGRRRRRSINNIVEEIKHLIHKYQAKQINFIDPMFPASEQEGVEFCETIIAEKLDREIVWLCLTHVKVITPRLTQLMKKAGCRKIFFGIESGNDRILKEIGKSSTRKEIETAVRNTKKSGIEAIGNFILGFPGETKKEIEETIKFSLRLALRYAKYNLLVPYPKTKIYNEIVENDKEFLSQNSDEYVPYKFLLKNKIPCLDTGISLAELCKLQKRAYFQFYLRPAIISKELCKPNVFKTVRRIIQSLSALAQTES